MKYRKNIFGKTVIDDDNSKSSLKKELDQNNNPYIARQLGALHFLAGFIFIWEVLVLVEILFKIEIKFTLTNSKLNILNFFLVLIFPHIFGLLRIFVIDRFLDTFSLKLKWLFTGLSILGFAAIIFYETIIK